MSVISTHGGGTIPFLVRRLQDISRIFGTGGPHNSNPPLTPEEVRAGFATFYYDLTAATSSAQMHALLQLVPTSQLLMGFDYPFMPQWSIEPARDDLKQSEELTATDLSAMSHGNAEKLFPQLAQRIASLRP